MVTNDIDCFVESLPAQWQRQACVELLGDTREAARLDEHIKWGQPYFDHNGAAVTKWFCARDWINVYFFRGRELADPQHLFEPSLNKRMLAVKVTPERRPDRSAFRNLVCAAVELAEKSGGRRGGQSG